MWFHNLYNIFSIQKPAIKANKTQFFIVILSRTKGKNFIKRTKNSPTRENKAKLKYRNCVSGLWPISTTRKGNSSLFSIERLQLFPIQPQYKVYLKQCQNLCALKRKTFLENCPKKKLFFHFPLICK